MMAASEEEAAETEIASCQSKGHEVIAKLLFGSLANMAEWYDFAMFGLLAPQVGKAFFPSSSDSLELMKSFGVFAAAFIMRPLGGLLFGIMGDTLGRKKALYLSVMLMAASTVAVGILPTYEQIGYAGPLLLVLCRMLQGISAGGQLPGTLLLTTEGMPENQRAFYFSITMVSGSLASGAASFVVALLHEALTEESFDAWGWRIPFLTGIVAVVGALGVDSSISESPEFEATTPELADVEDADSMNEVSMSQVLWLYKWQILQIMVISAAGGCVYYNIGVWLPSYLIKLRDPPMRRAYFLVTAVNVGMSPFAPVVACLADSCGPMRFLMGGLIGVSVLTLPAFVAFESTSEMMVVLSLMAVTLAAHAFWCTNGVWMPFLIKSKSRYIVVAVGYNLGMCVVGGSVPLVSTMLTHHFGTPLAAGVAQLVVVLIAAVFAMQLYCVWEGVGPFYTSVA